MGKINTNQTKENLSCQKTIWFKIKKAFPKLTDFRSKFTIEFVKELQKFTCKFKLDNVIILCKTLE